MRWVYLAIVVLFIAVVLIFVVQNTDIINISFLGSTLSAPLALIVLVVYLLGAATGSSLYAVLRRSIKGSRRPAR
jgi:lipopolysaccharide assembly protein A